MIEFEEVKRGLIRLAGRSETLSPKREKTRQAIIKSARDVIATRGIQRTSMAEVATSAAVSRGTLYAYAKNRDDLVLMCLAEESLSLFESFLALFDPEIDARARLEALIKQKIMFYAHSPFATKLAEGDIAMLVALRKNPHFLEVFGSQEFIAVNDLSTWVAPLVEADIAPEEWEQTHTALTAFIGSGPTLIRKIQELQGDVEETVECLAKVFVAGIIAKHGGEEKLAKDISAKPSSKARAGSAKAKTPRGEKTPATKASAQKPSVKRSKAKR